MRFTHILLCYCTIYIYIHTYFTVQTKWDSLTYYCVNVQYIFIYILILQYQHYHCSCLRWCMYHMCRAMRSRLAVKVGSHSLFRSGSGSSAPMPRVKLPSWNCESTSKSMLCRVTHVMNILLTLVTSWIKIGIFRILNRFFMIPKTCVHVHRLHEGCDWWG